MILFIITHRNIELSLFAEVEFRNEIKIRFDKDVKIIFL